MRKLFFGAAVIAMAVSGSALTAQPDGKGKGSGNNRGNAEVSTNANTGGPDTARGNKPEPRIERGNGQSDSRGNDRAERRQEPRSETHGNQGREQHAGRKDNRAEARHDTRGQGNAHFDRGNMDRGKDRVIVHDRDRDRDRHDDRRGEYRRDRDNDWDWDFVRRDRDRRLIDGCPPGLAKKHNGCTPPGLDRVRDWDGDWDRGWYGYRWRPSLFGLNHYGGGRYYYDDGYLYRIGSGGLISGYVPLLGGALGIGSVWPSSYQSYDVPPYYVDYYNLGGPSGYRYADNVLYRVNPDDAAIMSVAALLTGNEFNVGQRMPAGYDVYNVPYAYRDRYYDTPDASYRYSDGYVYQIDPETQLIAAAIELLI